jgi:hypothetical protein
MGESKKFFILFKKVRLLEKGAFSWKINKFMEKILKSIYTI